MYGIENNQNKKAYKDKISVEFVRSIKARREAMGLTQDRLEKTAGLAHGSIWKYEKNLQFPNLRNLIKLAEFFKADISESINWKCWHGEIDLDCIRKDLVKYGVSYREADNIDDICNNVTLYYVVHGKPKGSVRGLAGVIEFIEKEKQREQMREEMLAPKKRKRAWFKAKAKEVSLSHE